MSEISWRSAALLLGEKIGTAGPEGYYAMQPKEWYRWAVAMLEKEKNKDVRS